MPRELSMKKVLMIAYHYPPLGGGGVFRTLKFTKYLPQFGFQPYVLTVKNPMQMRITRDTTLLGEIPPQVKVFRTFSFEHRVLRAPRLLNIDLKWFYIPDVNIGWIPFAVHQGQKIIKKEAIDTIYATAPPFTNFLIGYLLKRKTGKPLVLDFRDPWTQNVFAKYPTMFHRKIEEKIEKSILKIADYIITTTEPMRLKLMEKYPLVKGRCGTITNGFDSEDFEDITSTRTKKFTITYTGYLYGFRTAKHFLIALKNLLKQNNKIRNKIQVVFAGPTNKQTENIVKELELENVVKIIGYIPHRTSLKLMVNSDVLLLIIATEEVFDEKTGSLMIPGKIFEYLGAKKPILALIPRGAAADLIRSTNTGIIVPPTDTNSIKQKISKLFQEWSRGNLRITNGDISKYDRKVLTEKLAKIFQSFL